MPTVDWETRCGDAEDVLLGLLGKLNKIVNGREDIPNLLACTMIRDVERAIDILEGEAGDEPL